VLVDPFGIHRDENISDMIAVRGMHPHVGCNMDSQGRHGDEVFRAVEPLAILRRGRFGQRMQIIGAPLSGCEQISILRAATASRTAFARLCGAELGSLAR